MQSKAKDAARVSRQYEEVYETNLDWEHTLTSLAEVMKVIEPGPQGIRSLYWKNTYCSFGANGGLDIHSTSLEELEEFISLLQSRAVYHNGQDPQWKLERSTHGKKWYKEQMQQYKQKYELYKRKYEAASGVHEETIY
ncbi:MAG: hypothetical protein ABSA92_04810 [Candidatus Bathyarchaeia archaeon]